MPSPRIDVLIPVFNAAATVRQAIESIQGQTVTDIRIIVVNDGSTDDTPRIVAAMAELDPRIELHTTANGGIVDALNFGLRHCAAPYVARQDGDDLAYPGRFAEQLAYLDANPDCVAVGCAVRLIAEDGRSLDSVARPAPPDDADPDTAPSKEPYIIHPFLMARLAAIQQVGGYRYVFHAEDTDLYWRLQEMGRLHNLPSILGEYRMHTASVSSSVRNGRIAALNSQLCSISAKRRRQNQPDLTFIKAAIDDYNRTATIEDVFQLGSRGLAPEETRHLELTLAAKFLELTSYRPFELDANDCRYVRRQVRRHMPALPQENRAMLQRMCNGAVTRMILHADFRRARELAWPSLIPGVLARVAFRMMLPQGLRRRILRSTGRATFFK